MNSRYFLQTKRLGLRHWHEADVALACGLWGDEKVTRLIDARGKLTKAQVQERLTNEIACQNEYGLQYWPIFLLENGEHVGCCGLRPYDLPQRIFEIGFHIRSTHWRQGYASEAAVATINYAFNEHKAAALFAGHNPRNESSRLLLLKLGFTYTHDEFYPPTGLNHPSYLLRPHSHQDG